MVRAFSLLSIACLSTSATASVLLNNFAADEPKKEKKAVSCGALVPPPNSKAKNFKDSKKTYYDAESKKHIPVVFNAGDVVDMKCVSGYTLDGSKDGGVE